MNDYVLVCYPTDPIEPGETVDNHMRGYASPWHALYAFADVMRYHPSPMIPTRIDVLVGRVASEQEGGTAE